MGAASRSHLFKDKPVFHLTADHVTGNGRTFAKGTRLWVHDWFESPCQMNPLSKEPITLAKVSPLNLRLITPTNIVFTVPASILTQ